MLLFGLLTNIGESIVDLRIYKQSRSNIVREHSDDCNAIISILFLRMAENSNGDVK